MNFLACTPSVFVIGSRYEILINTLENGIVTLNIGNDTYYEENSGVLSSEKSYAKIRVDQEILDRARSYTVNFRKSINRKAYYSELGDTQSTTFEFKPLTKTENINIYHIADVHYRFAIAESACSFFGDDVDLFVVNGDIGEVETERNYLEVARFVGNISKGRVPVIFARGNHDTRGHLAERFTDIFPADGKSTYFGFSVGSLEGIVLDCGEDKIDNIKEYGGVNIFENFRRRELEFLKALPAFENGKISFAVSHMCPAQNTLTPGDVFDIDREVYEKWNTELSRIGIKFMVCGHIHKAYILEKNDKRSLRPHDYPVIVGSACFGDSDIWGTAITLSKDSLLVRFTDKEKSVREEHTVDLTH
ncbi:MAG: metallophosphoesterase [Clostridia bacterium]|nr:metallophosphoesterase [Clostridia bacterium]